MTEPNRCPWCGTDPLYVAYHDDEWGVPEWDSRALFEKLLLDGFQAGLSWYTILKKRDNFRDAFDGFEPAKMARYTDKKVERLMADAGIVRNRAKILASIGNAQAWLDYEAEHGEGSFATFIWSFVDGTPKQNRFKTMKQVPAETPESKAMSKELKKLGFKFCGPTITYAFMQACGLVNDHLVACPCHDKVAALANNKGLS